MEKIITNAASVSDNPSDVDRLGYEPYINALARILTDQHLQTPYTVGIYGRWGTGKSTFMHLLSKATGKDGFICIPFQPWQFDGKEEVWKALIMTVVRRLEKEDQTINGVPKHSKQINELVKGVTKLAFNQVIKYWTSGMLDIDKLVEFWAKPENDNTQFLNTFRNKFAKLRDGIISIKEGRQRRLFIFIDDLDRCTPEACIMVLEAVKLFFDMEDCVFVIGIDSAIVQQGIEFKYKDKIMIGGQEYLEKLIQLPFTLPPVKKETFENYVSEITSRFGFDKNIQKLVTHASARNPRHVKQLSNCMNLIQTVSAELLSKDENFHASEPIKLAGLLVLQARYPIAFRWFVENPQLLSVLLKERQRYEEELSNYIKPNYGDLTPIKTKGFFDMLQFVSSFPKFSDFQTVDEVQEYLQITGLVAEEETPVKGVTARQGIDESLEIDILAEPTPKEDDKDVPSIDASAVDINWLTDKRKKIEEIWKTLKDRRAISLWWANTDKLVSEIRQLIRDTAQLKNFSRTFDKDKDKQKILIIRDTLNGIDENPIIFIGRKLNTAIIQIISYFICFMGTLFYIVEGNFYIPIIEESYILPLGCLIMILTIFRVVKLFACKRRIRQIPESEKFMAEFRGSEHNQ